MTKTNDLRLKGLHQWIQSHFPCDQNEIVPLAGDASFRRYFRVNRGGESRILVDSPPELEKTEAFVGIAQAFAAQGVGVPTIFASDLKEGFLLISDLGEELFSAHLNSSNVDSLYLSAMDVLLKIQQTPRDSYAFPAYDHNLLQKECELFSEWYLGNHLKLSLSAREEAMLESTYARLIDFALAQPTTVVHRDYHSRNLMLLAEENVGVLDFQDAVIGPITYDLASLLKDCYIAWPQSNVVNWAQRYFEKARQQGVIEGLTMAQFLQWFDLMAVQRHLKCIGIFSRLALRDQKIDFLTNIPRLLDYILGSCARYPQLNGLAKLIQGRILRHESHDSRSGARNSTAPAH
jgi:hypothetical protein